MIIYLWTKILQYTWEIWQIILSPEDVCFQFQYPQIIFQPICQFEFMIKKIGVQFFSQLNHPRENFTFWQPPDFRMQKFCSSIIDVFTRSFKYSRLQCRVFWLFVLPRPELFSMKLKSFLLPCIFVKNTVTAVIIIAVWMSLTHIWLLTET